MSAAEQSELVSCRACTRMFERGESERWKVKCWPCWKEAKDIEKAKAADGYSEGFAAGRAEGMAERMAAFQRGFEAGRATSAPSASAIDKTRIRQLLQLVHPDKHGGSELATTITTWLLSLRKECE